MKDKIIEILKIAYGRASSLEHYEQPHMIALEDAAEEIDSLYPTLNRDKVMEMFDSLLKDVNKLHSGNVAHQKTHLLGTLTWWKEHLCSLSLPTLSEEEQQIKNKILKFSKQLLVHELWLKHCSTNYLDPIPQWMTEEQFFEALAEIGVIELLTPKEE